MSLFEIKQLNLSYPAVKKQGHASTCPLSLSVRTKGLEPPRRKTLDPKSSAATNFVANLLFYFRSAKYIFPFPEFLDISLSFSQLPECDCGRRTDIERIHLMIHRYSDRKISLADRGVRQSVAFRTEHNGCAVEAEKTFVVERK